MTKPVIFAVILFGGLYFAAPAHAQRAHAYVSVDSTRIGDRFELTLVVGHDGSRSPVFPHHLIPDSLRSGANFSLGDFEILAVQNEGGRPYGDAGRLDSVVYEATTFAIDTARVAGIPIGLALPTDTPTDASAAASDTFRVASEPFFLTVVSLLEPGTDDIRDITDIAEFPRSWWPWVVLALVLLAAVLVWLWYRRRQGEGADVQPAAPPVPPVTVALERLTRLEAVDLRDLPDVKAYYVELADILRTYFGQRAHVPALEATTRELVERLTALRADRPVPRALIRDLHDILDQSDLVKFADIEPVVDRTRAVLKQTRETVEKTEAAYRAAEQAALAAESPPAPDSPATPGSLPEPSSPPSAPDSPAIPVNPYAPKNPQS